MARVLHEETPGGDTGGSSDHQGSGITHRITDAEDNVAQLRRRHRESYRCPPLDSGLRDPWRYPAPSGPRAAEAARDTYHHLATLGYADRDGWLAELLGVAS